MAYDRYDQNIRDRSRNPDRNRGRNRSSMFDFDRNPERGGDNRFGGWAGDGRTSAVRIANSAPTIIATASIATRPAA